MYESQSGKDVDCKNNILCYAGEVVVMITLSNKEWLMFWCIANFKMYKKPVQEISFFLENRDQIQTMSAQDKLIFCPSFLSLSSISFMMKDAKIMLGAQNCAIEEEGAFTGEVSATSLAQVGVRFVIIGHSERRLYQNETDEVLISKLVAAFSAGLVPIFCVGESKACFEAGESISFIQSQLQVLSQAFELLSLEISEYKQMGCIVAYEPVFSIGTGIIPPHDHIEDVLASIENQLVASSGVSCDVIKIYGGSVNAENAGELKSIPGVEGFLIGKSSINFAEFKKIIDT